jgi:cobalt-zinc-cadmium efflux system membrane fusion protein
MHLDEKNLVNLRNLLEKGAASEAQVRAARNAVSADLSAIARVRRTLQTWKVSSDEMDEIEKEALRIIKSTSLKDLEKIEKDKIARRQSWARVEIRAPFDGMVVEKNVTRGQIVDTTTDLFKIARLSRLAVFANAYEEDQRILRQVQQVLFEQQHKQRKYAPASAEEEEQQRWQQIQRIPIPWVVHLTSDPEKIPLPSEAIERIGYIVDPNQKTNLAIGRVENTSGELRVGQSVTAEVEVPPPPDVVSVPVSALVEDGETSVLFVQLDGKKHKYAMKQVVVVERFNGVPPLHRTWWWWDDENNRTPRLYAYIRSKLDREQKDRGFQELKPGEMVVVGGAIELKAALEEVQARARRK